MLTCPAQTGLFLDRILRAWRQQCTRVIRCMLLFCVVSLTGPLHAADISELQRQFHNPPAWASPWVFWYWMNAAVSREGITADLRAMQQAGIGGAYLMPVDGPLDPPIVDPPVVQLTPEWWAMVRHAATEADRFDVELAMHLCDGWAVAGGPWITPQLSMQQLVWSETHLRGGQPVELQLEQPPSKQDYYRDVAVLALPSGPEFHATTATRRVAVTTNAAGQTAQQLIQPGNQQRLRSAEPCWIEFAFEQPFTLRSVTIKPDGRNYQCQRFAIQARSGEQPFRHVGQLSAPRHGWQDESLPVTHAVSETTADTFRLLFDPTGSEPGAEDLDYAKWSPVLKVTQIQLASAPRIHHYRGKSGTVWRVGPRTSGDQLRQAQCVPMSEIIDLSQQLADDGRLQWDPPPGDWTILRFGHTSTGKENETGGGGQGLECDKFNPAAIRRQYERWFGEARRQLGTDLASRVLTTLHVDSWECGAQNWTALFPAEFQARRGYSPLPYLPAMAGYPIESIETAERFLYDVRQTIAELVDEKFFGTLADLSRQHGCKFTAENVAPTFLSDGMQHFRHVDVPMGEFWLESPTHDKPADIRDAISAGHVYGKPVIAAEAFTQLRNRWSEHPAMLKPLADRHYCQGVNRLVYHVFAHNPFLDRKPGVTLRGVGHYLQRDQTWWRPGRAWFDYCRRVQTLLQQGQPVADVAIFTGEELPRRALLPEQLTDSLPGLIGETRLEAERERLANRGAPVREQPAGVKHSANMTQPEEWLDPLRGYKFDSINRDALLRLATVQNGRIRLPGGSSYGLLVLPGSRPLSPHADRMTPEVASKLTELVRAGGNVLLVEQPTASPSLATNNSDQQLQIDVNRLWSSNRLLKGSWTEATLESIGIERDLTCREAGSPSTDAQGIAWQHRRGKGWQLYFVSNQQPHTRDLWLSLRSEGRQPELWNPVTGKRHQPQAWRYNDSRTELNVKLPANGSIFVVLRDGPDTTDVEKGVKIDSGGLKTTKTTIAGSWHVTFIPAAGPQPRPLQLEQLIDLSQSAEEATRHFAGSVKYTASFDCEQEPTEGDSVWLEVGQVGVMAEVSVNGKHCGVAWTPPYRVDITSALQPGQNELTITVATTWRNRLIDDQLQPKSNRTTWTTGPQPASTDPLQPTGLMGPVTIEIQRREK